MSYRDYSSIIFAVIAVLIVASTMNLAGALGGEMLQQDQFGILITSLTLGILLILITKRRKFP